jgi:hypothetical protein
MLKISYFKMLQDHAFGSALKKIRTWGGFKDLRIAQNFHKICKAIEAEVKDSQELWDKTIKNFAVLDEKGGVKLENGQFNVPEEKTSSFKDAADGFFALELELDYKPFFLHDLTGCSLSPDEIGAIECLLSHVDEKKTPTVLKSLTQVEDKPGATAN